MKSDISLDIWNKRLISDNGFEDTLIRVNGKGSRFNVKYMHNNIVLNTLTAHCNNTHISFHQPVYISKNEVIQASSFPLDYDFNNNKPHYICGMSVPPLMIANIASEVYKQWLTKIK